MGQHHRGPRLSDHFLGARVGAFERKARVGRMGPKTSAMVQPDVPELDIVRRWPTSVTLRRVASVHSDSVARGCVQQVLGERNSHGVTARSCSNFVPGAQRCG